MRGEGARTAGWARGELLATPAGRSKKVSRGRVARAEAAELVLLGANMLPSLRSTVSVLRDRAVLNLQDCPIDRDTAAWLRRH